MNGSTGAVWAEGGGAPNADTSELGSGVGTVIQPSTGIMGHRLGSHTEWPFVSTLELGALPTAVGCGRDHTKLVLKEWGLDSLVGDAVLLVSELLTNALKVSWTGPVPLPVALRLLADDYRLIIEAWDRCVQRLDVASRAADDAEHGRGLMVVEALSNRWGVRRPSYSFKVVWCELEITGMSSTEV
jgi:anti-sigma regulatory factor (Ser/Thr protein kinase)